MSRTLADLVRQATTDLERSGIDTAAREARLLVAMAANIPADRVNLSLNETVRPEVEQVLAELLERRGQRRPLSHITGVRAFFRHEFMVTGDVLDPRPETETLVEAALAGPFDHVLDIGTGSGCILLSLLAARPRASGVGTDLSAAALDVARVNAARLDVAERCLFLNASWFEGVEGRYDLIVSNPPYVAIEEMAGLAPELHHEPRMALTDEGDGLSAYRVIVPGAVAHLKPGGRLMVEIGWQQGAAVADLFGHAGFDGVRILPDLDGRDRVVVGVWPANPAPARDRTG